MSPLPSALDSLLAASNDIERERAWERFLAEYTRLLLHVARSVSPSHDSAMDAYTYVLDQLSADQCRQLRKYGEHGQSKFTTWLVVVVRRMCLDHYRQRCGRRRECEGNVAQNTRNFRRRLQTLLAEPLDAVTVTEQESSADDWVRTNELQSALDSALATLSPSDQLLLKLRFEDELSAQQIANLVGFPSAFHVYRRLKAVTSRLRVLLIAKGIESAAP